MSSEEIDMAFYCNHMALHLVRSNDDFEIYGPIIMNAEIIAHKNNVENIYKLGIGQKRQHLYKLVEENYPQIQEILEIKPEILPYSLEGGLVDGAVIDITKAILLPKFKITPLSESDYISYCLVIRKDIIDTKDFKDFLTVYNKAIEELNQQDILIEYMGMSREFWDKIDIKFLSLE